MRGSKADLPKTLDVEELTIHEVDWGDMHVNLVTCHRVLDMAPLLKGLPDDKCQCPHWGTVTKGRKVVKYRDREEVINAGDLYYMAPGHSTITDAGTELIEFSPKGEALDKLNEAVSRNLAAMSRS